jgi:carbon monoxide dehydrogenase subunit G
MKVAGETVLHAPIDQVWAALNDPAVLVRTIPGCERLETVGPDSYAVTLTAGVASIKGTYSGTVALSDQQAPSSFLMRASGVGAPGTVSADVRVTLTELDGGTRLQYDADAQVGGVIGGVGQRMLAGVAKKLAAEFFAKVDRALTAPPGGITAPAASAAPAPDQLRFGTMDARAPHGAQPVAGSVPAGSVPAGSVQAAERGFVLGALVGAVIALVGVLVGSRAARRAP